MVDDANALAGCIASLQKRAAPLFAMANRDGPDLAILHFCV
jgi:hypothetical protein